MSDLRRWCLVLGGKEADGTGAELEAADQRVDGALAALYERKGGLGKSAPQVARWLGDIRELFVEPELLEAVVPDVHLVASLVALAGVLPARARESARVLGVEHV